ncbi:NTP transferase domain-containing protein, partial [candidate division KSB1 bacterium]|nr:NTP transferase domain-containing protein [candidate division KSB1 bacterium]
MPNIKLSQAVILAGGRGTRLRPLTDTLPKPMIQFHGKPFLEHLINNLREQGITKILLLLGYLPEVIKNYFGNGERFGIHIDYSITDENNDTGRRIKLAESLIDGNFLLMYCDNYWPLDLERLMAFHNNNRTAATVTVYTNKDGITRNNMYVDENGYVVKYDKSRTDKNLNGVEIGFFILEKKVLDLMPDDNFSFEKVVLPQLIEKRQLSGYLTDHRYYSIGSLERISKMEKFLQ